MASRLASKQGTGVTNGLNSTDWRLLAFAIALCGSILLLCLIYWFGFRDTWEITNYDLILKHCDAVKLAIGEEDDKAASEAYYAMQLLIGDRILQIGGLANRVEEVRSDYQAVAQRILQAEEEYYAHLRQAQSRFEPKPQSHSRDFEETRAYSPSSKFVDKDAALTRFQRENDISDRIAEAAVKEWVWKHGHFNWNLDDVKAYCLRNKRYGIPHAYLPESEK